METATVISKLNKGVDLNIIKKVEIRYGKLSHYINIDAIKESKVNSTEQILENDDTLSYIDRCMRMSDIKLLKRKFLMISK